MIRSQFILPFGLGALLALALVGGAIFAGPLLTPSQSFLCPILSGLPTSYHGTGFLVSRPTGWPNSMQFVIRPNSTAFLTITYWISNVDNTTALSIYANWTYYFRPIQYWYRLGSSPTPGMNTSQVGMTAYPVNATANGNHVLTSTYEVSASANAEQGAFNAAWFDTCGPQIVLTVGYSLYNGPGLTGGKYL